jgi:hypothetical protein
MRFSTTNALLALTVGQQVTASLTTEGFLHEIDTITQLTHQVEKVAQNAHGENALISGQVSAFQCRDGRAC